MNRKGNAGAGCIIVLFWAACMLGYFMNIAKLISCDFKAPYKAETIRVIGVFTGVVGAVAGWLDIED